MADMKVTMTLDTGRMVAWVRFLGVIAPMIGDDRAYRWAMRYGLPLIRVRFDERGRWERPFRWHDDA
jgi:hypothetical protein